MTPRCPKCNALPAYIQEGAYVCMMCGKRWPVNGAAPILITKITGGKSMTETKKTPSGKRGPCVKCGKVRYIASKAGHCHTCNNQVKGKKNADAAYEEAMAAVSKSVTTTPDRDKTEAIETLPASQEDIQKGKAIVRAMVEKRKTESAPDLTVKEVGQIGYASITQRMREEQSECLARAEKLGKAIVLLESL